MRAGRSQISNAGVHIIDGIAYGRTYIRKPSRPPVHIPPRKRPKVLNCEASGVDDDDAQNLELVRLIQSLAQGNAPEEPEEGAELGGERENVPPTLFLENGTSENRKRKRGVRFEDESETTSFENFDEFDDVEDEDDDNEEDFEPSEDNTSGEERLDDEEEAEEEINEDSDSDDEAGFTSMQTQSGSEKHRGELRELKPKSTSSKNSLLSESKSFDASTGSISSSDSSSSSSSDSDSSSASDSSSNSSDDRSSSSSSNSGSGPPEMLSSKVLAETVTKPQVRDPQATKPSTQASAQAAPGHGKPGTKARNARRRIQKKLKHQMSLVENKVDNMNTERDGNPQDSPVVKGPSAVKKRKLGNDSIVEPAGPESLEDFSEVPAPKSKKRAVQAVNEMGLFEAKRHALLKQIATGGVDIETDLLRSNPPKEASLPDAAIEVTHEQTPIKTTRNRLDIASSRRLLFGSLGVRTPKDKAEEEKLRAKLSATARKPIKAPKAVLAGTAVSLESKAVDSELWRKKIDLRAVECYDEGIELSTPPFPFVQRWDPQQQLKGKNKKNKKKKQYAESHYNEYAENDQSYGQEEENGLLDYDDATSLKQTENNQVSEQLMHEIVATSQTDTDLPSLPNDLPSCESLTTLNALPGAIIAFKQLEVSAATKWQPSFSAYRTATIDSVERDFLFNLRLARRDRKNNASEYDDKGQRVYGKFEMPDDDEEEEIDDGAIELALGEMVEPKLIQAAPNETAETLEKELDLLEKGMEGVESQPTLFIPDSVDPAGYHSKSDDDGEEQIKDSQMTMQEGSSNDFNGGQAAQRPIDASADSYGSSSWMETTA